MELRKKSPEVIAGPARIDDGRVVRLVAVGKNGMSGEVWEGEAWRKLTKADGVSVGDVMEGTLVPDPETG